MAYLYLAKQIGIVGVFALWAYLVAKGLFARTSLRLSFVQEVAFLVPVGLGVAILFLFGLGIAGALTAPGIVAGAGLALALSCWRLRGRIAPAGASGAIRAIASAATPARLAMIAIACTVLVPVALRALTPPIVSDEVRYHLPYALHFVEQGRIVPDLYLRFPFFTLNVNLLYAAALVFGDDVTPHFMHLLLGFLAGLALYALAAPKFGRVTAFGAVLLFLVTPNFARLASTAYIDLGLAAFVTAAIACLDRARGRPALVVCAGLAFGAALGTKYLALAFLPLLVAWAAYRTRHGREVARFACVAVLTGAPWYVYNVVWTGNPVSPFAGEWFSTWPWTAEDLAGQVGHLAKKGHDASLTELLSLPWYLLSETWRFGVRPVSVPVLLLPGLVALALLPWWDRRMRPYGVIVLVVVTVWFYTAAYFRYLTAIVPLWCLVSAWSVERILGPALALAARRGTAPDTVRRRASYAAATIVVVLSEHHFWRDIRWLGPDAVTERVVYRERYLRNVIPVYGVAEHLRRSGIRDEAILVFPPGALLTYVRNNRIVGDHFGPMGRGQTFDRFSLCKDRLVEALLQEGVSRLVVLRKFLDRRPDWDKYLASRLTTEYADGHATLFRIEPGADPSNAGRRRYSGGDRHDQVHGGVSPAQLHASTGKRGVGVIPYFSIASGGSPQGLARIVNHSDEPGTVVIHGTDDTGTVHGPIVLNLGARQTRRLDADHVVACRLASDASGRTEESGPRAWRLSFDTDLDIETLAYIRNKDRFVTSVHEVVGTIRNASGETVHDVPFFNDGDNRSQVSRLRLSNSGRRDIEVTIAGRDDAGMPAEEEVRVALHGGTACWLSARELESGASGDGSSACGIVSGRLGNGRGRWRLRVRASGEMQVMNLLETSTGHLTNLSAPAGDGDAKRALPLVLSATDSDRRRSGLVRIVNDSGEAGTVVIRGIDDTGMPHGPVTLALDAYGAVHLGSRELEAGNASKGLPEGLGDGAGNWRLKLDTELDIDVLAYVRTNDGFLASIHEVARAAPGRAGIVHHVPYFDLGTMVRGNRARIGSILRLINSSSENVEIAIEGRDHTGAGAPKGVVRLTLPPGQACTLSAKELETGAPESGSGRCAGEGFGFGGRFGDAAGIWSLFVTAVGGDIQVMSLVESPNGHLANLSAAGRRTSRGSRRRTRGRFGIMTIGHG